MRSNDGGVFPHRQTASEQPRSTTDFTGSTCPAPPVQLHIKCLTSQFFLAAKFHRLSRDSYILPSSALPPTGGRGGETNLIHCASVLMVHSGDAWKFGLGLLSKTFIPTVDQISSLNTGLTFIPTLKLL